MLVLALGCAAAGACAWQAGAHEQTVAALDVAINRRPSREALIAAVVRLLPHVQDDERLMSREEYAIRAAHHCEAFTKELNTVRQLVKEQRDRYQELASPRRRRLQQEDPITAAIFGKLDLDFQRLSEVHLLADTSPFGGSDQSEASRSPPTGPWTTRRSSALTAFRHTVHEMLAGISEKPDPPTRLSDQYHDAQMRVVAAWRLTLAFAIGGAIIAILLFSILERSLWKPLRTMRNALERIASRRYGDVIPPKGAPELVQMFGALSAICERGKCSDDDREKEVEDRSKQRVRSERLAGIGLLATSVAHEINNPLTAIVGAADGLNWRLSDVASMLPAGDGEVVKEYLAMIVTESKRCRAITTKLLDFARGREGDRALYDVTAIVNDVVGMFRHMREYSSRTVEVSRQDPVRAFCNGPEIKQVVLNLVANALQATPAGGRLDIRIASSPDAVEVVFTDTGSGMSAETLEHIFDPFFSTKGPGAGTGLGLSISHAIVEKHHGALEAHSAGPGQGSTFRLRLPATENAAKAVEARRAA